MGVATCFFGVLAPRSEYAAETCGGLVASSAAKVRGSCAHGPGSASTPLAKCHGHIHVVIAAAISPTAPMRIARRSQRCRYWYTMMPNATHITSTDPTMLAVES